MLPLNHQKDGQAPNHSNVFKEMHKFVVKLGRENRNGSTDDVIGILELVRRILIFDGPQVMDNEGDWANK